MISYCDIIVTYVYIVCYIIYFLQCTYELYHTILCQVKAKEQEIKHKLRPNNAFLKAKDMNLPAVLPREELHQFLLGLYGEHILPATLYSYTQLLRAPELYTTPDSPLVTDAILRGVWTSLRARLSSLDAV